MLYYSGLSRTLRQLRWVLYPRRCPFCDRVLGNQPACPDCADGLAELRRAPSMRLRGSEHYLGRLDGAAAPYRYTGLVRRAVLRAKYQGAPWAAVELGVEMARLLFGSEIRMCGSEPLPEPVPGLDRGYDCILPVPASSKKRGYNVPERMAQPLARAVGVPVVTDALTRARSTRRQEGLSLDERLANVAGAFRVARPEAVEGKRILLVDDVLTTGATASACAQALLDAGAQSVFAVALATVEFPQPVGSTTAIAENEEEICRDIRISAKEVEKLLSRLFFYPKTARREDDTMKYKHLSYSDRQEMEKLYLQGWHMNDIAEKLGVSLATVYHERARGDTGQMDKNGRGGYSAELAQSKIYARRQELQERH